MNENSVAIITLCSTAFVGNVKPLNSEEWHSLAMLLMEKDVQPQDLLNYSENEFFNILGLEKEFTERLLNLNKRSTALFIELSKYESMGIRLLTRADKEFPKDLKKSLNEKCPPILYYAGNIELLNLEKEEITEKNEENATELISLVKQECKALLINKRISSNVQITESALCLDIPIIELTTEPLLKKLRQTKLIKAIQRGKMIILSEKI